MQLIYRFLKARGKSGKYALPFFLTIHCPDTIGKQIVRVVSLEPDSSTIRKISIESVRDKKSVPLV